MAYLPRILDHRLSRLLRGNAAVRLEGPRGCGKTTTGLHHTASAVHLDTSPAMVELAQLDPGRLLTGPAPRLVDEWRLTPTLWNQLHEQLGTAFVPGRYLLASSATPMDYRRHTQGADQLPVLGMRTLALAENPRCTPQVSLAGLAHGDRVTKVRSPLSYRDLAGEAVRGGWPELVDASIEEAMQFNTTYLHDLTHTDVAAASPTRHQPARIGQLLASLARHTAREVSLAGLAADTHTTGGGAGRDTVRAYLDALTRVHTWEPQPAWQPPLRTRARLRHHPRAHLAEPALACAALQLDQDRLADDPDMFAAVFTSMVIHDLRVYLEGTRARLYHYRDETGLAIAAIIEYADGGWAAIQTSLGEHRVVDAAISLHKLCEERLDLDQTGQPRFLAVITGGTTGHTTRNNTYVIPLATLTA